MATKKNLSQADKDARDRDIHINTLATWWGESFAGVKDSLRYLSDRDVRIMADNLMFGGEVR